MHAGPLVILTLILFASSIHQAASVTEDPEPAADPGATDLSEEEEIEYVEVLPLGYTANGWKEQQAFEMKFAGLLKPGRIRETLRVLSARPHRTGTPDSKRIAIFIQTEARKAGFDAEMVDYLFYNSHPGPRSIRMTAPVEREITLEEDRIEEDRFARAPWKHRAFVAYSGSGRVEGEVVYAGNGTVEEFRTLEENGVSLEGRIALMRYFGAGEGAKVLRAQKRGAVGAVLYADPLEDGFVHGAVYPEGNWRPPGAIMRRSIVATPYAGDPLSPGFASTEGSERLDPATVEGLPRIPVLPISYRDAALVLSHLGGPRAPDRMQGGIVVTEPAEEAIPPAGDEPRQPDNAENPPNEDPGDDHPESNEPDTEGPGVEGTRPLEYRLGPGPARLALNVRMTNRTDTIHNIIVKIPGEVEPDAWVILGNHHDAWIYGAGDPSSGTAADLEILRALGELWREGWRPRRTLIIPFWDAEEMDLGGSSEWAEEHAEELRQKGVAVVNMDSAVFNGDRPLYVGASPILHRLFREVAQVVPAPIGSGNLADTWLRMQNEMRGQGSVDGFSPDYDPSKTFEEIYIDPLPLGDDQTTFVLLLSLPGSDMYYGADYGMYHSLYENFHWMSKVVDPNFAHHWAMSLYHGLLGLRLAMAPILPLDPEGTASAWNDAFDALEKRADEMEISRGVLEPVRKSLKGFERAAKKLGKARDDVLEKSEWTRGAAPEELIRVNRHLASIKRSLYQPEGLPGYPYFRNIWAAPAAPVPGLDDWRLPGLRWPIELDQPETLSSQVAKYVVALDVATNEMEGATELIATLPQRVEPQEVEPPDPEPENVEPP